MGNKDLKNNKISENRAEDIGISKIYNSFNYDKKRIDALNNGRISYYFKLCEVSGIEPEQEVIDTYPTEYNDYLNWSGRSDYKKLEELNNLKKELSDFIDNSIEKNKANKTSVKTM